ncbi:MAG TPA: hypothetical protein VJR06_05330, partial [Nitrososphaerales archaeon]|nr:hypothetical protein [Nitrososphaerales archaeon]
LIIVALMLVSIPVSLALQFPRQVDPATAPTDPVYGQGLYLFYGSVVVALTGGNYSAARALLGETPFIHIPPEILDAVNSFDSLVNNTANQFRVINYQLANASNFLATGRVSLARANLTAAVSNLRDVNQTLTQLLAAEPQLAALTGIPSSLLLQKLQPLETIYNGDVAQADRLLKVLTGLSKLEPTSITLSVVQVSIIVGSNVTVSGLLRGPTGSPLDSRNVSVFFQGRLIGKATTDSAGRYSAQLRTPFFYQKNATMFASFLPAGGDSLVYAPATSPLVNVTVTFVTPSISFTAPNSVNAGQPLTVNGTLTLGGRPLGGYQVSLSGFKTTTFGATPTSTGLTGPDGTFSVSLTPSSSLGRGTYPVTLGTSSNGTVGPLLVSIPIDVNKETPVVDSTIPGFALAGFPVTISGSVKANGSGIAGAQVLNTSPSPSVDTATSRSGG